MGWFAFGECRVDGEGYLQDGDEKLFVVRVGLRARRVDSPSQHRLALVKLTLHL